MDYTPVNWTDIFLGVAVALTSVWINIFIDSWIRGNQKVQAQKAHIAKLEAEIELMREGGL